IRYFLQLLFRRKDFENNLDEEIELHLEEMIQDHMADGMSRKEARRAALKHFGGVEQIKENCRDSWGMRLFRDLIRDANYALRLIKKDKGHAILLVMLFALCIGPSTILFNILNSLYFNPDRYPDEDRIYCIYDEVSNIEKLAEDRRGTSTLLYLERKQQSNYIESIGVQVVGAQNVQSHPNTSAEFREIYAITPSIFDVLGVQPFLGRRFYDDNTNQPGPVKNVVVLMFDRWQSTHNADPDIIGKSIIINGVPKEVIGVMPESFSIPPDAGEKSVREIGHIIPLPLEEREFRAEDRHKIWRGCYARVKPNVTKKMLERELAAITDANSKNYEAFKEYIITPRTLTLGEYHIADIRGTLLLSLAMAIFVLLTGSLSLANYVLAKNSSRLQEISAKISLGATQMRLIRQFLAESSIIAIAGTLLTVGVSQLTLIGLDRSGFFSFFPMAPRTSVDAETILALILLATFITLVLSLASITPLLSRARSKEGLHSGDRTGSSSSTLKRYRGALVLVQSAIAVILLVVGGLLFRSFLEILDIDPGYDAENVLVTTIRPPEDRYSREERYQRMIDLETEIRSLPGVRAVGTTKWPPMRLHNIQRERVISFQNPNWKEAPIASRDTVSPGYFEALGISPLQGRLLMDTDIGDRSSAVVIDSTLAKNVFGSEDPIGKQIAIYWSRGTLPPNNPPQWRTVVGVINPVRIHDLYTPSTGVIYQAIALRYIYWFGYVIKTDVGSENIIPLLEQLLLKSESDVAVGMPRTLKNAIAERYAERKNLLYFCLSLTVVGLTVAILGTAGVISCTIATQRKEIGIRMALGEHKTRIIYGTTRNWLKLALSGILLGIIATYTFSNETQNLLYETNARDPLIYFMSTVTFMILISIAAFSAAIKCTSIKPIEAMYT
ncbi:MAG: ABC transporter permease, partial [Opitutales bacterium]|nr:ABC transporter permease [Opitutales bacterium]